MHVFSRACIGRPIGYRGLQNLKGLRAGHLYTSSAVRVKTLTESGNGNFHGARATASERRHLEDLIGMKLVSIACAN